MPKYGVANSEFVDLHGINGGAIYYYVENNFSLYHLRYSIFICCSSTENGGAIYIIGPQVKVNNVCGYMCLTKLSGSFAYTDTSNLVSVKHIYEPVSITKCGNYSDSRISCMYKGNQNHRDLNSTFNHGSYYGSFAMEPFNSNGYLSGKYVQCLNNSGMIMVNFYLGLSEV